MTIYVRFNDVYKHCQYCKKSTHIGTVVGLESDNRNHGIYWCNRNKCVVTAICYCDDGGGFVYDPEKKNPTKQQPSDEHV